MDGDRAFPDGPGFPERRHVNALTLRPQLAQEGAVLDRARWAREQVAGWPDTTDRGGWDDRAALTGLLAEIRKFHRPQDIDDR